MRITATARQVARVLAERELRVVFAESCTAGLVSATLSEVAGISQWHCGSAVTYRDDTKSKWLGVKPSTLRRHSAVSETVARQMAVNVLGTTPEAHVSAAVTGHLGPEAPAGLDGVIFVAVARRVAAAPKITSVKRIQLATDTRRRRQSEAAGLVFQQLLAALAPS